MACIVMVYIVMAFYSHDLSLVQCAGRSMLHRAFYAWQHIIKKRQGQEGIDRSLTRLQQGQVHEALKLWHAELCVKDLPMPPGFSHQTQVSHDDSTTCAATMQAKVQVRCLKVALG